MAGFVNPITGNEGVSRHSTCDDVGGCTALGFLGHCLLLVVLPGTLVESAVLGHYVGEGEGSHPAAVVIMVAIGVQMAPVQTRQVLVVTKDSLALADFL